MVSVCVALFAIVSCGHDSPTAMDQPDSTAFFEELRDRDSGSMVSFAENLADYLPSQQVSFNGEEPRSAALGVAYGSVTNAEVTFAGKVSEDGPDDDGEAVRLDSPDADWRMVTATVAIDSAWLSDPDVGDEVAFTIPISGTEDPAVVIKNLEGMDRILLVLTTPDKTNSAYYRIALETAIGQVDESGRVSFPGMTQDDESAFLADIQTLQDIDEQASKPQPVIEVRGAPSGKG